MIKIGKLAKQCATGLIAAQLLLGTAAVSTLVPVASADAATLLVPHGAWRGMLASEAGEKGFGIFTDMEKGGSAALVVKGEDAALAFTDPSWKLKAGDKVAVRVEIDGEGFTGEAIATDATTLQVADVSDDIVLKMAHGAQAIVNLDGGRVVWTLDLDGFSSSLSDAAKAYKRAA